MIPKFCGTRLIRGYIGIQNHDAQSHVLLRNIRIKDFSKNNDASVNGRYWFIVLFNCLLKCGTVAIKRRGFEISKTRIRGDEATTKCYDEFEQIVDSSSILYTCLPLRHFILRTSRMQVDLSTESRTQDFLTKRSNGVLCSSYYYESATKLCTRAD